MSQFSQIVSTQPRVSRKRIRSSTYPSRKRYSKKSGFRLSRYPNVSLHSFVRACTNEANPLGLATGTSGGFYIGGTFTNIYNMQMAYSLTGTTVYIGGGGSTFTMTMPNYTELTALYDQYRIDYVENEFYFSVNSANVSAGAATCLPVMALAKDYDDTGTATMNDLNQYNNCITWQLGASINKKVVRVKPCVDVAVYNGLTNGYAKGNAMYLDTSSAGVPHYGMKLAFTNMQGSSVSQVVGYLFIKTIYHMSMKNTK